MVETRGGEGRVGRGRDSHGNSPEFWSQLLLLAWTCHIFQLNLQVEMALAELFWAACESCAGSRGLCAAAPRPSAAGASRSGCRSHLRIRPALRRQLRVWVSIQYSAASVSKTTSQHTTPPPAPVFKERKTLWKAATRFLGSFQSRKKGSAGSSSPRARRRLCSGQGSRRLLARQLLHPASGKAPAPPLQVWGVEEWREVFKDKMGVLE